MERVLYLVTIIYITMSVIFIYSISLFLKKIRGLNHKLEISMLQQKQAEEEAHISQEKFSKIFDSNAIPISITRINDGKLLEVNQAFRDLFGYNGDDLIGHTTIELNIWQNPEDRANLIRHLLQNGAIHNQEFQMRAKNRKTITVYYFAEIITFNNEHCVMSLLVDITARKKIEDALRESEERFRSIVESSPTGMHFYKLNFNGKLIFSGYNPAADRIIGISHNSLINKTIEEAFPNLDSQIYVLYKQVAKGEHGPQYFETYYYYKERQSRYAYAATVFQIGENSIAVNFVDISDRKREEEELRNINENLKKSVQDRTKELESAQEFVLDAMANADIERENAKKAWAQLREKTQNLDILSKAIESNPASVVVTDENVQIQYVNPKFTEVTGYLKEEVLGQNPRILKSGKHSAEFYKKMWDLLSTGNSWQGELCNKKKNGELFWESAYIFPVKTTIGEITHYVAVKENITERKNFIQKLETAKEAADTANKAKSIFLANMSHEIRTPMNAILGFSQLMLRDVAISMQQKEHLNMINRAGEHLLAIINDILEMSKIEAGRTTLNSITFDLYNLIHDIEMMFIIRAKTKGLEFTVSKANSLPQFVSGDEGKLRQILINLISNAVKFTKEGSVIITCQAESDCKNGIYLKIDVKDTGPGINPKDINKLFRPFEQTDAGIRTGGGTGLGLAISREFAHLMGGQITVESVLGKGSCFHLEVCLARGDAKSISPETSCRHIIGLQSGQMPFRILIADDIEDNRILLSQMLKNVGFETRIVSNGKEVLKELQAFNYDLLLIDLYMPEMSGYEAICRIRTNNSLIPIIAVTASAFEENRQQVIRLGVNDFIGKPFKENELFEKIGNLLKVKYVYKDGYSTTSVIRKIEKIQSKKSLAKISYDLLNRIREATINGDFDGVIELASRIEIIDTYLADGIKSLAQRFDSQQILELLDKAKILGEKKLE